MDEAVFFTCKCKHGMISMQGRRKGGMEGGGEGGRGLTIGSCESQLTPLMPL